MQPRIDTNLGIQSEPDAWMHSACILCSNGCGLEMAVVGRGGDGGRYGPAGEVFVPFHYGYGTQSPTSTPCTRATRSAISRS